MLYHKPTYISIKHWLVMLLPQLVVLPLLLVVFSLQGCFSSESSSPSKVVKETEGNNPPTASFASNCPDLNCSFNGSNSTDPDGTIVSYSWDYGDGTSGNGSTANHSYAADGSYLVMLTVTDDGGSVSASTQTVTVVRINNPPTASFTSNCTELDCSLNGSNSTDSDGTIVDYSWDFDDGTNGNGASVNHSYSADGSYVVILTVTDDGGVVSSSAQTVTVVSVNNPPTASFTSSCTELDCSFDASASTDSDGTIIDYSWNFGDSTGGSSAIANHSYVAGGSYQVTLTVTDDWGLSSSSSQTVTVVSINNPPIASFTSSCPDLDCNFDASASTDPDGTIVSYSWDFGDALNGSGASVNHSYLADGSYTVTLTVTDNEGSVSASTQTVTVSTGGGGNNPPTSSFTFSCTELDCSFNGSNSTDPDGTIVSYSWDYGDGTTGSGTTANHSYTAGGSYLVTLTITDDGGAASSSVQTVTVVRVNNPPTVSFTSSCTELDCSFNGSNSTDPDGTIVSYSWDFGDGASGSGATANHSYAADGSYTVTLTVTDDGGAVSDSNQTVTVVDINISPTVSFTSSCLFLSCSFDASNSTDSDGTIVSYDWDFDDGTTGSAVIEDHDYAMDGTYTVMLTVTDNEGAASSSMQTVIVTGINNPPTAFFTSNCTDLGCSFDASASADSDGTIASYSWDFGDGTNGNGEMVNHNYVADGSYTVTLTVTDDEGLSSGSTQTVTVADGSGLNGQLLFSNNCATCHGDDAQGGALAPAIVGRTAADITNAINTVNQMRSLSALTAEEIQAIADYLGTL